MQIYITFSKQWQELYPLCVCEKWMQITTQNVGTSTSIKKTVWLIDCLQRNTNLMQRYRWHHCNPSIVTTQNSRDNLQGKQVQVIGITCQYRTQPHTMHLREQQDHYLLQLCQDSGSCPYLCSPPSQFLTQFLHWREKGDLYSALLNVSPCSTCYIAGECEFMDYYT